MPSPITEVSPHPLRGGVNLNAGIMKQNATRRGVSLPESHPSTTFPVMRATEVPLNWTTALRVNDIDILVNRGTSKALIVWPWFKTPAEIRTATERAKAMGYTTIVENGHLPGYQINETTDCDYMMLGQ